MVVGVSDIKSIEAVRIRQTVDGLKELINHISGLPEHKKDDSTNSKIKDAINNLEKINLTKIDEIMQKYNELKALIQKYEKLQ